MVSVVLLSLVVAAGTAVAVLWVRFLVLKKLQERRFLEVERAAKYALPDAQNGYLRDRLQTALAVSEGELEENDVGFLHAKKLLYALSEKRLSGADSLIVRKLQKDVGRYEANEYLPSSEKRNITTIFSKILSLCAKYEI